MVLILKFIFFALMQKQKTGFLSGSPGAKTILILFLLISGYVVLNGNWQRTRYPIQMDANGYYIYLPAAFIYHDLEKLQFADSLREQFDRKYFLYPNIHGGYVTKYAPGVAVLQLPFFLAAHLYSTVSGALSDGYSPPYRLAVAISSIFYTCLGFLFLFALLRRYFPEGISIATVLFLALGTNIFFYSALQAGLVHNYLFFLFSLMLLSLDNWNRNGRYGFFALACAITGFITLIRPTEVLSGLIPAAFFFHRLKQNSSFLKGIQLYLRELISGAVLFFLCLLPLILYWKYSTGNWLAYTYEQEGFYFDRPWQIWYGLFGFRKGWFVYTPMAAVALAGLWFFVKDGRFRPYVSAMTIYLPVNIFIVLSWYCWWYGGGFGQRAFIPSLALLAFPLSSLLENLWTGKARNILWITLLFIPLNLFQAFQYQRQILHMDSMTWSAYRYVFGKWKLSGEEKKHLQTLLDPADYSQRGKKLDAYFR
jgi:hypothetical protein